MSSLFSHQSSLASLFPPLQPLILPTPLFKGTSREPWGLFPELAGNFGLILRQPLPPVWEKIETYSYQDQSVSKDRGKRGEETKPESDCCVCPHVGARWVSVHVCVCLYQISYVNKCLNKCFWVFLHISLPL